MGHDAGGDVLLVGPGWLGAPAATALAAATPARRVFTASRTDRQPPAGCHALTADVTRGMADPAFARAVTAPLSAVVVCVAPSRARGDSYAVYPAAARGAATIAEALGAEALVYISSTGVYDRHDGSAVDERTLIAPASDRVRALFDAELTVLATAAAGCRATVLRAAGLYGPGRDPGPRFAAGSVEPESWCNFSWRDDVIAAMRHVLTLPATHGGTIYNCTDNTPVQAGAITHALTGLPAGAAEPPVEDGTVRAGRSNQRISSAALLATGWRPTMPTVFDGLRALGHSLPGHSLPGHSLPGHPA
ncbi:NAD-dependent epimerase/dehydratase family protein [Gemmatimonas sp.]|uniref:NAD-dependent epimerase/dehydratase family protein n=1 Tax=Gemmatimonas sp. TaxID=1962908 RepID=UPI0037BF428B